MSKGVTPKEKAMLGKEEILECEDCLIMNETVKHGICPYEQDLNGREVEATLCPSCYHYRAMAL